MFARKKQSLDDGNFFGIFLQWFYMIIAILLSVSPDNEVDGNTNSKYRVLYFIVFIFEYK